MRRRSKMQIINNSPTDTQHTLTIMCIKRQQIGKVRKKPSKLKMRIFLFLNTYIIKKKRKYNKL